MDESTYFGLNGIRTRPSNDIIARLIEDYSNNDYIHLEDLSLRYGLNMNELKEVIESVLPSKELIKPVVIVRQSAV